MNRAKFTVLCTVFLAAFATSLIYAGASCCDPRNNTGQSFLSLPDPQGSKPALPLAQTQNAGPRPQSAAVTSMGSGWNVPQKQVYSGPAQPVNAPAAPSCCSGPNNTGAQQVKPPVAGCGCGAGGSGCQGNQSGLLQGSVKQSAPPYPQPAAMRYPGQQNPQANGATYRPASSGAMW
jgi:hypothetical protein